MDVRWVLAVGAIGGVAVLMVPEGPLSFQAGYLIGGALGGMFLAYAIAKVARWI